MKALLLNLWRQRGWRKFYLFFLLYKKGSLFEDGYASLRFSFQIRLSGVQYNQKLPLQSEPLCDSRAFMDLSRTADAGWLTDMLCVLEDSSIKWGCLLLPLLSFSLICFFCYILLYSLYLPFIQLISFSPHSPPLLSSLATMLFPNVFLSISPWASMSLFCISITKETLTSQLLSPLLLSLLFSLQVMSDTLQPHEL